MRARRRRRVSINLYARINASYKFILFAFDRAGLANSFGLWLAPRFESSNAVNGNNEGGRGGGPRNEQAQLGQTVPCDTD